MAITVKDTTQATEHVVIVTNTITEPGQDTRLSYDVACDACGDLVAVLDHEDDARNAADEHEVACLVVQSDELRDAIIGGGQ